MRNKKIPNYAVERALKKFGYISAKTLALCGCRHPEETIESLRRKEARNRASKQTLTFS